MMFFHKNARQPNGRNLISPDTPLMCDGDGEAKAEAFEWLFLLRLRDNIPELRSEGV